MPRLPRTALYERLDAAFVELRDRLGGLPSPTEAEAIWTTIWYEEAHHSTALEGNTLVLKQVERLLADGVAVGNKELSEYLEVRGYAQAARWVYGQSLDPGAWAGDELVTMAEIRHIHQMALGPVWDVAPHPAAGERERPGSFREHEIAAFPGGMTPPSWVHVPGALRTWIDDLSVAVTSTPRIESIAAAHHRFEQIHPFIDGNGRAGRLVLNLMLVRLGYAPVIVYKRDRIRYLDALRAADRGDIGQLGELLARAVLDNLYRFIVPAVAGPRRLVPLAALATKEISEGALRIAATRSRLQAQKDSDGTWRSTRAWVDDYIASRRPRSDKGK